MLYRVGACDDFHVGIKNIKNGRSACPPKCSIVNKNYFGSLPSELIYLIEVELELCKYNKIGGHIFSLYGGAHTSIRGHHTLYFNKPDFTSKVLNYYSQNQDQLEEQNSAHIHQHNSNNEFDHNIYWKNPFYIQVVLVGPFTKVQKDIARRKTSVDVDKVLIALRWLKKHNILYRDLNIGEEHICMPKFVDLSSSVESQDSNVEKGFSYKVVFVDHKEPTQSNGGYKTCQEFKEASIKEKLLNIKNPLICRASSNIVWYYQDQNLYKSFPELQI